MGRYIFEIREHSMQGFTVIVEHKSGNRMWVDKVYADIQGFQSAMDILKRDWNLKTVFDRVDLIWSRVGTASVAMLDMRRHNPVVSVEQFYRAA